MSTRRSSRRDWHADPGLGRATGGAGRPRLRDGLWRKVPGRFEQNGVRVHWLTLPSVLSRKIRLGRFTYSFAGVIQRQYLSLRLGRLARGQGINVVESHDFNGPLAWKPAAPLIVRLHGSVVAMRHGEGRPLDVNPLDRYYEKRQIRLADHIIAVSRFIGPATQRALGMPLQREVIYNGVDTERFSPSNSAVDPDLVLFAGTIMWRKSTWTRSGRSSSSTTVPPRSSPAAARRCRWSRRFLREIKDTLFIA